MQIVLTVLVAAVAQSLTVTKACRWRPDITFNLAMLTGLTSLDLSNNE